MVKTIKKGDKVQWNSEVGKIDGTVEKKLTKTTQFKGKKRPATKEDPQYVVKSAKTGAKAIHKPAALKKK